MFKLLNHCNTKKFVSEFKYIWLEQCPHILIMKPSTDLCHTCKLYGHSLTNSGNLTEEEKTEVLAKYQNHIEKVKMQRDHYRKQCEIVKTNEQFLKHQSSPFHYGSKFPAVTITVFITKLEHNR
jgi:hypothetical protein